MAAKRSSRAAKRNAQRRAKNQAARQAGSAEAAQAPPERARYITQLSLLLGRASITQAQYRAGDRLYRDWRASGSEPAMVAGYERMIPSSSDMPERQALARSKVTAALRFVGPIGSPVLVHVCLIDGSLPTWEQASGTKSGDGAAVLRAALDRLREWFDREGRRDLAERDSLTPKREVA